MNEDTRKKILQSTAVIPGVRDPQDKRLRERLSELANIEPPPDYDRYLRSKSWQIQRQKFLAHYGCECALCGSKENLHVHHLHYQTVGKEKPEDVAICCRRCHFIAHLPHNDDPKWAGTSAAQHTKPKT